ncbi:MAG: membrane protein insertase YidC [Bacteroidetes bacterium]|nr:membrane protein insertase YidC [Bacteroidota bacterium]
MNKNTIIGLILIFAIIIVYSLLTRPSKEEIEAEKRRMDSIREVQMQLATEKARLEMEAAQNAVLGPADTILTDSTKADSLHEVDLQNRFGFFADAAKGKQEFVTIENSKIRVKLTTLGGRIYSVELKNYKTWDSLPLILFDGDSTVFGLKFFAETKMINTNRLFFTFQSEENELNAENTEKSVIMTLKAGAGRYIEYKYTLEPESFVLKFDLNLTGMQDLISGNSSVELDWQVYIPGQEKGMDFENRYTAIYYKHQGDEVDNLTEGNADDEEKINTSLKWIGYKQQFFTSFLIAESSFPYASLHQKDLPESLRHLKKYSSTIGLNLTGSPNENIPMKFYFGPNRYNTLNDFDLDMERVIPLGWGFFLMQWINRFAVIPVFNFLENYIGNYGIVILILTILLKIVLFPIAYKSYTSTAKMRVLKPQVDEINAKIPKEKAMERQQAVMAMYKKAGVNPMGGCIPMLLQFPILIAMFRFFPASIELRQKSFLWATDLSTYDSVLDLPFDVPFYGDHISLFCLLMTASTIIYTKLQQSTTMSGSQMPGMKFMMYVFPVMFLFIFNSYASGLSYYYLLANLLTFAQMAIIKRMIDEEALLKKLEASKKKPVKKSGFQARLEKMAKQRGYKMPKR